MDHGGDVVGQDVGWRSFLMRSLIIDVEEGVTDDDRLVRQEVRAKQLSRILTGEIFQVKLASARGDFKSEVFAGRFFTWV